MASAHKLHSSRFRQHSTNKTSYWQVFRLIFVVFSLYLMGDAFYRWDGFRYYSTFFEFLPSVSLITIFWTIISFFVAMVLWLLLKIIERFCSAVGWTVKLGQWLMTICAFMFFAGTAWIGKKLFWKDITTTFQLKVIVLICVICLVICIMWLIRNKTEKMMEILQERITPLVWLFGLFFIISVPLVAYHTWGKKTDKTIAQEYSELSTVEKGKPNIILVIFDALTARDMSVYGYQRQTTPFIAEWAKNASLFTRLEAESNYTAPTISSLMTGKMLWTHKLYHPHGYKPLKSNIESMPLLLKKNGYYNMAFVVNPVASPRTLGIDNSFDIAPLVSEFNISNSLFGILDRFLYQTFGDRIQIYDWIIKRNFGFFKILNIIFKSLSNFSVTEVPPDKAFNRFLEVLDDNPPEPFFAWIHLYPPHDPYLPPKPYMGKLDSASDLRTFRSQEKLKNNKHFSNSLQPKVDILRARYDEFIRYCDKQFEDFITQLTLRGRLENTIIIFTSDHGESFEHNYLQHGGPHLYEQLTHIPLIIKEQGQNEERIIDDLVEQIDIPATILDLANIPVPFWMEGRSLVPLMRGKSLLLKSIYSMNFEKNRSLGHKITKGTIAVWDGNYKLIHYLGEEKSLLFNLKQDIDELENLFDKEIEVGSRLLALIKDNLKKANERISRGE